MHYPPPCNERPSSVIDVSVVIVTWNVADYLSRCIESVFSSNLIIDDTTTNKNILRTEIIVVDSCSTDHTLDMLSKYPQIKVIKQTENTGYTKSVNIGLAVTRGRYVLLLNPDTEVLPDTLQVLSSYLDNNPRIGIVGPQVLNSDRSIQDTRRRFPTIVVGFLVNGLSDLVWMKRYVPKDVLDYYYVKNERDDAVVDVEWLQGSFLLARREVYEQIGGLDIRFWMYYDDTDWCRRAKESGWKIVYNGSTSIIHHQGKSSEQVPQKRQFYYYRSKILYFQKHHGILISVLLFYWLSILHEACQWWKQLTRYTRQSN
ncbi:glycosyltransferase family 2 protein [Candidatus Chloroploca sp. Khr17]|uniref:glycosyltransferase family 2 protein n=1 Tax=Candidatus Chloroploca sp. Khr17 TaxID=2496869 RepID=UPI00101BE466|nr:glycosyltransferase family 2 protein [Candidatus Chloroploca sp. Khr17]